MILYLLDHRHQIDEEYYDTKLIGIYSSQSNALNVIKKYSCLPGFCDFKTEFHIEALEVKSKPKKGTVYLLTVTKVLDEDEITISYRICQNLIFAGVLWMVKSITSFGNHRKVYAEKHNIDKDNWTEGFITVL